MNETASTRRLGFNYEGIIKDGKRIVWSCGHSHTLRSAYTCDARAAIDCANSELDRRLGEEHVRTRCNYGVVRGGHTVRCPELIVGWCLLSNGLRGYCMRHESFYVDYLSSTGQCCRLGENPLALDHDWSI